VGRSLFTPPLRSVTRRMGQCTDSPTIVKKRDNDRKSGQSTSVRVQTAIPSQPKLGEDLSTDVCVVGAGIAGMTIAYLLGREGKSVLVATMGR
jgi:NADPH-dependent 2,4-dienoyl-CoA reductase/sulfur reductase-like enzyme